MKFTSLKLLSLLMFFLYVTPMMAWEPAVPPPPASSLYSVGPGLSAAHPRFMIPSIGLSQLQKRTQDPAYAFSWSSIKETADRLCVAPPLKVDISVEDPVRAYSDGLPYLALAYLLETKAPAKARYLEAVEAWLKVMPEWTWTNNGQVVKGLPRPDLGASHMLVAMSITYDWLYQDLSPSTKTVVRTHMIQLARWLLDPANVSAVDWHERQFLANHNWWNYAALGLAGAVLYGETAEPLAKDEAAGWIEQAMIDYWYLANSIPKDGIDMEGINYEIYAAAPLLTMAYIQENLLKTKPEMQIGATPGFKKSVLGRWYSMLPEEGQFLSYGDSYAAITGSRGAEQFYYLASKYNDGLAQSLANRLVSQDSQHLDWRCLFYYNPTIKTQDLSTLPGDYQFTDMGLNIAKSYLGKPAHFSLLAGPSLGATATDFLKNLWSNGHLQPRQGDINFYFGNDPVLPSFEYGTKKMTTNHNLVVVDGKDSEKGLKVGQKGEGAAWFNHLPYINNQGHASLIATTKGKDYINYLVDLGSLYYLADANWPTGGYWLQYRRSVTYFENGTIVLADKVTAPLPRNFTFRLLTGAAGLVQNNNVFNFDTYLSPYKGVLTQTTVRPGIPGRITDYSQGSIARFVSKEQLSSYGNPGAIPDRTVLNLLAQHQSTAVFAVKIDMGNQGNGVLVKANEASIVINRPQGDINLTWQSTEDTKAPAVGKLSKLSDQAKDGTLQLRLENWAKDSGICNYEYKIGTSPGSDNLHSGKRYWAPNATTTLTVKAPFTTEAAIFVSVRAIDGGDNASTWVISDPIKPAPAENLPSPVVDSTPPLAIANLAVAKVSASAVRLTWTTPADDSKQTLAGYDLLVAEKVIDPNDLTGTKQIPLSYAFPEGSQESFVLDQLKPGTSYYFTLRSRDKSGNGSPYSNSPSFTTPVSDSQKPGAITALAVANLYTRGCSLSFKAPGNDGDVGSAAYYDVRVSTTPITSVAEFLAATQVNDLPVPKGFNTSQTVNVPRLQPATAYTIAIRAVDDAGNWSEIASIATTTQTEAAKLLPVSAIKGSDWQYSNIPTNASNGYLFDKFAVFGYGHQLSYDLGGVKTVGGFGISFASHATRKYNYQVAVSSDQQDWQTVFAGEYFSTTQQVLPLEIPNVQARYIKLILLTNNQNGWNNVQEFEVYGAH